MLGDLYWLLFALYAAFAYGVTRLLYRSFMRTASAYSLAIILSFMGFLWGVSTLIARPALPTTLWPWFILLAAGIIWALIDIIALLSYKFTPVSVREPIVQTELVWAFLLAAILGESVTTLKVLGIACIFGGMLLVTLHPRFLRASFTSYGVRMTLFTAILTSVAIMLDNTGVKYFTPEAYNPLGYLLPGLILLLFITKDRARDTVRLLRFKWKWLLLASFLSASMYYSILKAYQLADANVVYPFIHIGSIIVIIGGMIVFREERVHIVRKVLAAVLILIGAMFITGSTIW